MKTEFQLSDRSVRNMADTALLNTDSDDEAAAFVDREIARLLAADDPITRQLGALYQHGFRLSFIRWFNTVGTEAEDGASAVLALGRSVAHLLSEVIGGLDTTIEAKREILKQVIGRLVTESSLGVEGLHRASDLRRRGDA